MAKHVCRCKKGECEECPEWIFTFADLVMLMMGFFVILWVLKPPAGDPKTDKAVAAQTEDWMDTVQGIREGLGWTPDASSADPIDQHAIRKRLKGNGPGAGGDTKEPKEGATGTDPAVTHIRPGNQATSGGRLLFAKGDAVIDRPTASALLEIAELIRGHRNIVLVKGHAALDDFADGASPQQKMELSLKRAQAVAEYLTGHGVDPEILRVQGCSTFEPVKQRLYTPDGQALNRRVEVDATATLVPELQDPAHVAPVAREHGVETSNAAAVKPE